MRHLRILLLWVVALAATPAFAQFPALSRHTVTITSGQSVSSSIDIRDEAVVRLDMPASWTTANITYQVATNDACTTWVDLYDPFGSEITVAAAANRAIGSTPLDLALARCIRLRSGTSSSPVNQGGTRTIAVWTRRVQ